MDELASASPPGTSLLTLFLSSARREINHRPLKLLDPLLKVRANGALATTSSKLRRGLVFTTLLTLCLLCCLVIQLLLIIILGFILKVP
jgi:hypothetical protein